MSNIRQKVREPLVGVLIPQGKKDVLKGREHDSPGESGREDRGQAHPVNGVKSALDPYVATAMQLIELHKCVR